jgi:hypothetical protein
MTRLQAWYVTLSALVTVSCGDPTSQRNLIFVDGRGVAAIGDSMLAITRQGDAAILVRERRTGATYSRGSQALTSPHHVQEHDGQWYVSEARNGEVWIVVFDAEWEVTTGIRIDTLGATPHQFAVLPDGRIVLEGNDARLMVLSEDSVETFARFEPTQRTGFLSAASGGVLHAVPDRDVTLYNQNGNVRWRLPWDWEESAYMADLSVDARGRIHLLFGVAGEGTFVCFSLSTPTGEVLWWSQPGPTSTFSVERLGEIHPDDVANWIGDE